MLRFGLAGESYVLWEHGISLEQVENIGKRLQEIDKTLKKTGLSDAVIEEVRQDGRTRVDDVFKHRGETAKPAAGLSIEQFRQNFDRPDDLEIVETRHGTMLCLKRDLWYVRLREKLVGKMIDIAFTRQRLNPMKISKAALNQIYASATKVLDQKYPE
jgi:hypothetical protein